MADPTGGLMGGIPDDLFRELRQAQKRAHYSRIAWSDANSARNADLASAAARVYEADVQEVLQLRAPLLPTQGAIGEDVTAARWPQAAADLSGAIEDMDRHITDLARVHRDATP